MLPKVPYYYADDSWRICRYDDMIRYCFFAVHAHLLYLLLFIRYYCRRFHIAITLFMMMTLAFSPYAAISYACHIR